MFKTAKDQPHYYAQLQIEMLCTGAPVAHFFQWAPKGTKLEVVEFDMEFIIEFLPVLKQFYALYLSELDNAAHLEPMRKEVNTLRAAQLIEEYGELSDAIDRATERKKEVLNELVKICGEQNAVVCGHNLTKVEKQGAISYAKAIKALAPDADLEPWRGKPTNYWMLK